MPLALGFLAGYLMDKGMETVVHDEQAEPPDESALLRLVKDGDVSIVGITAMTLVIHRAIEIAEKIKKISKETTVILGGVHPTVMPEECLRNDVVDFVVRQEGEVTLWVCIRGLRGEIDFGQIAGLSFRRDGQIVHNPPRPPIENLDSLPAFPFHLFDRNREKYNFSLVSSRGCPFRCIFCSARAVSGYKYRFRSAEKVMEEIELLATKYGTTDITFHDDNFTFNKKRVADLCDLIIRRGFHTGTRFYCLTRADMVDREILSKMREAGFSGVYFGIETASNRLMKLIQKGESVEDNIRAVKLAKELGFRVRGAFMFGFPTETSDETTQTIRLARSLPLDYVSFSLATPFPGTKLHEIALSEGYRNYDFSDFNVLAGLSGSLPAYTPAGRSPKELMRLQKWAYLWFYLKPFRLMRFFRVGMPEMCLRNFNLLDRLRLGFKIMYKLLKRS